MSTVHSFAEAVQFAARCVECPICKEACVQPVRPKNCPHRYCMRCFRKCFQDKQEKHCATCRTPILSVSKRGFTEDDLFAKVADIVPGLRDEEDDEEFDIAAIMAKQKQQAAKIRQEALEMRNGTGSVPRCNKRDNSKSNTRGAKHSGAVQSNTPVHSKQPTAATFIQPTPKRARTNDSPDIKLERKPSLPPLGSHSPLATHPAASLAVPASTAPSKSMGMHGQQFPASLEVRLGHDVATNESGASTSMNTPFVDTRGMLGNGSLTDIPPMPQPASKHATTGNKILPSGPQAEAAGTQLGDTLGTSGIAASASGPMGMLGTNASFGSAGMPGMVAAPAPNSASEVPDLLRERLQDWQLPMKKKTVQVYVRASTSSAVSRPAISCDCDASLATCVAEAVMPQGGDLVKIAAGLRMTMDVDGGQQDVTLMTAGEATLLKGEPVVVNVSGVPSGVWV